MTKKIVKMDQKSIDLVHSEQIVKDMVTIFKELLENSLDANSNEISCFLKKFGLERIEFLDDGDGISKENLLLIGN